jgi:hypothetical protein
LRVVVYTTATIITASGGEMPKSKNEKTIIPHFSSYLAYSLLFNISPPYFIYASSLMYSRGSMGREGCRLCPWGILKHAPGAMQMKEREGE